MGDGSDIQVVEPILLVLPVSMGCVVGRVPIHPVNVDTGREVGSPVIEYIP